MCCLVVFVWLCLIDITKRNNFQESFEQLGGLGLSASLFNLGTCSNYSLTNYVKIPMFHFLEKVNEGQLKMVNVNYEK